MVKLMHEQVSVNEDSPIIARFYDYDHFTFPWHFHQEFEIIYVEESHGEEFVNDSKIHYYPGDILLIGANTPHFTKSAPEYYNNDKGLRVKGVIIQFKREILPNIIYQYPAYYQIKQLLERANQGIYFNINHNQHIRHLIEEVPFEKGIKLLTSLLHILEAMANTEQYQCISSDANWNYHSSVDNRFERVIPYIRQHFVEEVHTKDIAALIPMNHTAFCRYFKEKSSKTVTEYVQELRISYACQLMTESSESISQICFRCGFNNIPHFNRIFKRYKQITPTEYRKQFSSTRTNK